MGTTTYSTRPVVRPGIADRVTVQLPGSLAHDPEVVTGLVVAVDADSFAVLPDDGEFRDAWTLYDVEQADARCVVTVAR